MRKRVMNVLFAFVLFPVIASAQMTGSGGNHRGDGPASPPSNGMHDGNDLMGGAMGNDRGLIVGTDGTLYTVRVTNPAAGPSSATVEIVAVRPNGLIGWTSTVSAGMTRIELSGNQLLVTTSPHGFGAGTINTTTSSTLVALSAMSGSEQWRLPLDGFAADVEPFSGGTYVIVFKPGSRQSLAGSTRTLVAIGTDGKVLWSVPLTK